MISVMGSFATQDEIDKALDAMIPIVEANGKTVDRGLATRLVKGNINVLAQSASILDNDKDHERWLSEADVEFQFWNRYRAWLQERQGFPLAVVRELDEVTTDILDRLGNPEATHGWDRRGLVVGQVQSGKTANYSGLICKAADAGYKLIIVLAGVHNNLRAQTQLRLDEAFVGVNSATNQRAGVGNSPLTTKIKPISLTSCDEGGDFSKSTAKKVTLELGGAPVLLVVKKNAFVLRALLEWATELNQLPDEDGQLKVRNTPLLVVDDEADNASINTKHLDDEPTTINRLIRKFLLNFEMSSYVGYTATPFANLFVPDASNDDEFGDDLFPDSFIVSLRAASSYIGPSRLFGLPAISELDQKEADGLPLVRKVDDYGASFPDRHKKDLIPGEIPESLDEAIMAFVLACATRSFRGQADVHNSMLIHVTRFTDVQSRVTSLVQDRLAELDDAVRYSQNTKILAAMKTLWENDFCETTAAMRSIAEDLVDKETPEPTWEDLDPHLRSAIEKITVREINGKATDLLDYAQSEKGLSVIAIGGDKLSRGLTLEGLTVSYYLRASKMYDTLMQMGRWFGYRNGYVDVTRIYTTGELIDWYRHISGATEELTAEFEQMAKLGETPETYGLRVRSHPAGLLVTAASKMRSGQKFKLSYSRDISESIILPKDPEVVEKEFEYFEQLVDGLSGEYSPYGDDHSKKIWRNQDPSLVIQLLQSLEKTRPPNASFGTKAVPLLLRKYIDSALELDELTSWTIALMGKPNDERFSVAYGQNVGWIERADLKTSEDHYVIKRLLGGPDELVEIEDDAEWDFLREQTIELWDPAKSKRKTAPNEPAPQVARANRDPSRGLLLLYLIDPGPSSEAPMLGFGLSFPATKSGAATEYVVNNVYIQEELSFND